MAAAAARNASISACAVGSFSPMAEFRPRPTISPATTTTAPTGTSPAAYISRATTFVSTVPSPRMIEGRPELEVGYHLRRDQWGHGYATEAARACMDYAFRELAAVKVVSLIRPENLPR